MIGNLGWNMSDEKQHERCEKYKSESFKQNAILQFMSGIINALYAYGKKSDSNAVFELDVLDEKKCGIKLEQYICQPCDEHSSKGQFQLETGNIILCQDKIRSRSDVDDVMAHEAIHAFDQCRANVDWRNPLHHACSEIRAANISGDCTFWKELSRLKLRSFGAHHKSCVRRRASLSLLRAGHTDIKCKQDADDIIDQIFTKCYYDVAPFEPQLLY